MSESHNQNPEVLEQLRKLPTVELHRHIEGSVRLSTMAEFLPDEVVTEGMTQEEREKAALDWFCLVTPCKDLSECMDSFIRTQRIFKDEETIERITYEVCEDCYKKDGTVVLELRYSPSYVLLDHPDMTDTSVHEAVMRGARRAEADFPMAVGVIGIIDRFMSEDDVAVAAKFIVDNKDTFLGIDLANDEIKYAEKDKHIAHNFMEAKAAGLRVTIHSGEAPGPTAASTVAHAVTDMGAERIGHGIHVVDDPEVVALCLEKGIVFEVCPSSNLLTGGVASLDVHPLPAMMAAGLTCTLSTDDPGLFQLDLVNELAIAMDAFGLSFDDIKKLNQNAYENSFIAPEKKESVWSAAWAAVEESNGAVTVASE